MVKLYHSVLIAAQFHFQFPCVLLLPFHSGTFDICLRFIIPLTAHPPPPLPLPLPLHTHTHTHTKLLFVSLSLFLSVLYLGCYRDETERTLRALREGFSADIRRMTVPMCIRHCTKRCVYEHNGMKDVKGTKPIRTKRMN